MARDGALVALRADRLVDVEAGAVLEGRGLLVRGERIEGLLDPGQSPPDGAAVLDLPGHTLLPGLIDCHTHLVGELQGSGIPAIDRSAAQEALSGVGNARATVMAGFTCVRDVGTFRAFVDVALRDAIRDGTVVGPRMAVAGAYVTVPGGGGAVTGVAPDVELPRDLRFGEASSPAEVRQRVRAILYGGADFIKVIATGAVLALGTRPGAPELSPDELAAAVEEAAAHGTHVAAHAHGRQGIVNAALAGARSIEHGSLLDDEAADLLAERGTYLVADIYNGDYIASEGARQGWPAETLAKNEATTQAQRDGFAKAVKAGVRIAYGTDSGVYPHGWNARQLPYMVRHGMTPMAAIRSATVVAAELLGWQDRVGALVPGRLADVIAVPGDPLDDLALLADVPFVMQGGRVLKWEGGACPVVRRRAILSGVTSTTASGFVGRAEELDRLLGLLDRADRGRPAVGLIAGDAGVGKTRLLDELAARATDRGVRVLVGGCMEVGDVGLPYVPFVDAFRDLGTRPEEAEVTAPLAAAVPSLGRLLPELATDQGPAPPPGDGFERVQLFDGVLSLLVRLSELAPLLLVIEDLHWADRSTRDLLAFLLRTLRGGRVALVASYRSRRAAPPPSPAAAAGRAGPPP